eukprot:TRINITY_DN3896_c0_g1_i4.p1 TRINITY_DN3896_c0_g1~~TRINITY_DN3896_c0_g1_i4.p1  ORF type:complete len:343 (+),score=48.84 TRINITY_DN3896_c0_g1_i4:94-1122(+)
MIRRPPRSTLSSSSAASDVYKRQYQRRVRGESSRNMSPCRLLLLSLLASAVQVWARPEHSDQWTEESWSPPGSPGAPCYGGVVGICGKPSACTTGKIVARKCGGGNDNVCCVETAAGAAGGPCLPGADGVCGTQASCAGKIVRGKCSGGWNNVCCVKTSTASSGQACGGADVWTKVLAHPEIELASVHSSGNVDFANAKQEVTDAAAGKRVQRSSYNDGSQGPGGTTCLQASIGTFLLQIADELGGIKVNEIAGGTHGYYSSHYAGHGIDIGKVKGKTMNSANTNIARTIEICRANGANWMCTANKKLTNCASHTTWTHCQWNSWRSEVSRADMRKKGWPAV